MQINLNSIFVPNVGSLGSSSNREPSTARDTGSPSPFAVGLAPVWQEGEVLEHGKAWLRDGGVCARWGIGLRAHR